MRDREDRGREEGSQGFRRDQIRQQVDMCRDLVRDREDRGREEGREAFDEIKYVSK